MKQLSYNQLNSGLDYEIKLEQKNLKLNLTKQPDNYKTVRSVLMNLLTQYINIEITYENLAYI